VGAVGAAKQARKKPQHQNALERVFHKSVMPPVPPLSFSCARVAVPAGNVGPHRLAAGQVRSFQQANWRGVVQIHCHLPRYGQAIGRPAVYIQSSHPDIRLTWLSTLQRQCCHRSHSFRQVCHRIWAPHYGGPSAWTSPPQHPPKNTCCVTLWPCVNLC
jgi:hypothetical protein